jgi:hypothetical protein
MRVQRIYFAIPVVVIGVFFTGCYTRVARTAREDEVIVEYRHLYPRPLYDHWHYLPEFYPVWYHDVYIYHEKPHEMVQQRQRRTDRRQPVEKESRTSRQRGETGSARESEHKRSILKKDTAGRQGETRISGTSTTTRSSRNTDLSKSSAVRSTRSSGSGSSVVSPGSGGRSRSVSSSAGNTPRSSGSGSSTAGGKSSGGGSSSGGRSSGRSSSGGRRR